MRTIGAEYLAAYAAGGGVVDIGRLPIAGTSDRAAAALLAFVLVMGPVNLPRPAQGGAKRARPGPAHEAAATANRDVAAPTADAAVERVNEQLLLLAGLVGESNIGALAPAYAFVADGPGASPGTWQETVVRQAERLEVIRGEVLTLVALGHREVPVALKADALAAYAQAAGGAHEANAARLLLVARAEVADLDRRAAMGAAQAEAHAPKLGTPRSSTAPTSTRSRPAMSIARAMSIT